MKDLEPILNVLCNYQAGFSLNKEELLILGQWVKESKAHQQLFKELGSWTRIYMGTTDSNLRETILKRLVEMD